MFCCLVAKACSTLCNATDCSMPGFPVLRISWSLLKFMSIESVRLSDHLILCHPLFLLTSMFPSISLSSKSETLVLINPGFHTVTPIQLVKNPEILIHCRRQCFQPGVCEINNHDVYFTNTHHDDARQSLMFPVYPYVQVAKCGPRLTSPDAWQEAELGRHHLLKGRNPRPPGDIAMLTLDSQIDHLNLFYSKTFKRNMRRVQE